MNNADAVGILALIFLWCLILFILGMAIGALIEMWKNRRR